MKRLEVPLGSRSYPVFIGDGLLADREVWAAQLDAKRVLVVTNDRVGPLYLNRVLAALPAESTHSLVLPDGEKHKTVKTWQRVLDELVRIRAGRDACLVALGGGVIGDLCGFAAACYMRGIDFIQAPTTLLAQVDASVGGKTGVNHEEGKNLVGAFHQPRAVLADVGTLQTLAQRELAAGLAEVVKYGLIRDAGLFGWMEERADTLARGNPGGLAYLVERSVINKAEVVAEDEREAGVRALLNFGHSFGHALETLTRYERYLHGEAVAIGMVVATCLSELRGLVGPGLTERVRDVLGRMQLPVSVPPEIPTEAILASLVLDKKARDGRVRLVLLEDVGSARVDDRSEDADIREALRRCRS